MTKNPPDTRQKHKRTGLLLAGLVVLMFGFGFAMVPLYGLLCQVTGTQSIALRSAQGQNLTTAGDVDQSRLVTVKFDATVNPNLPWDFGPASPQLEAHPGQIYEVNFVARNRSSSTIVGQAIPSVAPWQATAFFNKLECFCFNRQTLEGNQRTEMPLRFMVSPDLPQEIRSLTLSYSFMRLTNVAEELKPKAEPPPIRIATQ